MTIKEKQCLLAYLGYYVGEIDGVWGTLSKVAAMSFQKDFGLKADGIVGTETEKSLKHAVCYGMPAKKVDDFWKDIKYFTRDEFKCRCGEYHKPYCSGFPVEPDETLVRVADRIRGNLGNKAHRSSGIRCKQHNSDSGGVYNSKHLQGKALDFWVENVSASKLLAEVKKHPEVNYAYIIENGPCVHFDVK